MINRILQAILAIAALIVPATANATPIDVTLNFSATDFYYINDLNQHVNHSGTFAGTVTFDFDSGGSFTQASNGFTVDDLTFNGNPFTTNTPLSLAFKSTSGGNNGKIVLAPFGSISPVQCGTLFSNDICLRINSAVTGPKVVDFEYSKGGKLYYAATLDSSYSTVPAPEPATWALMIAGLGFAGWIHARSRRHAGRMA